MTDPPQSVDASSALPLVWLSMVPMAWSRNSTELISSNCPQYLDVVRVADVVDSEYDLAPIRLCRCADAQSASDDSIYDYFERRADLRSTGTAPTGSRKARTVDSLPRLRGRPDPHVPSKAVGQREFLHRPRRQWPW